VATAKKERKNYKCIACSGHTTKLEQSISLDIYGETSPATPTPYLLAIWEELTHIFSHFYFS
jgi:hypothetical protein